MDIPAAPKEFDYIVVGAGFSGLYLCLRLLQNQKHNSETGQCSILLLEKNPAPGGRLQTETDENGTVLFERGAWRVPNEENHEPLRQFLKEELGIGLVPIPSKYGGSPPAQREASKQEDDQRNEENKEPNDGGGESFSIKKVDGSVAYGGSVLSQKIWDAAHNHVGEVMRGERETGYSGIWSQPENENRDRLAYSAREQDGFSAPEQGFSHVVSTLLNRLEIQHHDLTDGVQQPSGITLLVGANVLDIVISSKDLQPRQRSRRSQVQFQRWNVENTPVFAAEARCAVFVAVPPHASRSWPSFYARTRLLHASVASLPLCHVYARLCPGYRMDRRLPDEKASEVRRPKGAHVVLPDSFLQQVSLLPQYEGTARGSKKPIKKISGTEAGVPQQWIQISYSAGRLATTWRDWSLQLPRHDLLLRVQSELVRNIEKGDLPWTLKRLPADRKVGKSFPSSFLDKLEVCFWERAVHYFRPGVGFDARDVVTKCRTPNRRDHADVFVVGEAYSSFQGWLQGCIQTADLALQAVLDRRRRRTEADFPKNWEPGKMGQKMIINSWVLDFETNPLLKNWLQQHPGGEQAILNHLGERDSLGSLLRVQHSETALASAFYLAENVP
jgi:hypothetical protein